MSRIVVLDTETTGFSPVWHRIVEVGAVEVVPRSGTVVRELRHLINPLTSIPAAATAIHGYTDEHVRDQPPFRDVAGELVDFIRGSVLAVHNAGFDVPMLDAEFERAAMAPLSASVAEVVDTVAVAEALYPTLRRHDLNTLCMHLGVDTSRRTTHGALLDAQMLAESLKAMAREFDRWRLMVEDGCAAEVDEFVSGFTKLLAQQLEQVDLSAIEKIESVAARLKAVDSWMSAAEKTLEGHLKPLVIEGETWICPHFALYWVEKTSTSWKGIATDNLSEHDLARFQKTTDSQTYTPKGDNTAVIDFAPLLTALGKQEIITSKACLIRALDTIKVQGRLVEKARDVLREQVLTAHANGYVLQAGKVASGSRTSTNYEGAVKELCAGADFSRHQTTGLAMKYGTRRLDLCEPLFASEPGGFQPRP